MSAEFISGWNLDLTWEVAAGDARRTFSSYSTAQKALKRLLDKGISATLWRALGNRAVQEKQVNLVGDDWFVSKDNSNGTDSAIYFQTSTDTTTYSDLKWFSITDPVAGGITVSGGTSDS